MGEGSRNDGSGGGEESVDIGEGVPVGHHRAEVALKVGDDPIDAGGEQAEAAADAADEEGIEAVETGKDLAGELLGIIGLFAKEDGVDVGAFEEDDPVFREERMENGNEVNGGGAARGLAFGPDTNGINLAGDF